MREALHGPDKDDIRRRRSLPPQEQLEDTVDDEFPRAGIRILYKELQIYRGVRWGRGTLGNGLGCQVEAWDKRGELGEHYRNGL